MRDDRSPSVERIHACCTHLFALCRAIWPAHSTLHAEETERGPHCVGCCSCILYPPAAPIAHARHTHQRVRLVKERGRSELPPSAGTHAQLT